MRYTRLGRTGLEVSRICPGTMNFGAVTDEVEAFRMMDRALELGINFFDTANTYCGGRTEEIIGRRLAQARGAVTAWCWRRWSDPPLMTDPTEASVFRRIKSSVRLSKSYSVCKPIESSCTKCIMLTEQSGGMKSCRLLRI